MSIALRPAVDDDLAILDLIYTQNMRNHVEKNYRWNAELFKDNFVFDDYTVLQNQQEIVGFLKVTSQNNSLYLSELQIKSAYQNRGIGTKLLQDIIARNQSQHQRIWLRGLKGNPAIKLYQRANFEVFAETKTHY